MRSRCLLLCFHSGLPPSKYKPKRECRHSSKQQLTEQRGQRFFLQAQAVPALRALKPLCRNRRLAAEPALGGNGLKAGPGGQPLRQAQGQVSHSRSAFRSGRHTGHSPKRWGRERREVISRPCAYPPRTANSNQPPVHAMRSTGFLKSAKAYSFVTGMQ